MSERPMYRGVFIPAPSTLERYGLSLTEWKAMWRLQGSKCPICEKVPSSRKTVIDHEHVGGWVSMPPLERKLYVRGIVCVAENHFLLTRYGTPLKHRNAATYLEAYAARRPR